MTFTPRLTAPYSSEASIVPFYFSSNNPYYPTYQMPNCTCYSFGRLLEIANLNQINVRETNVRYGNGGNWGDTGYIGSTYEKGTIPKPGAIAVWTEPGEAGHCAVVEQVNADGTYICSNSGYYRPIDTSNWHYFFLTNCSADNYIYYNGARWGNYVFKYFLYPPYIDDEPTPPKPPGPTPFKKKPKSSIIPLMNCKALPNNLVGF